jgi:hypothetical protein
LLKNRELMNKQAHTLLRQGIALDQKLWGGWLGEYHKALRVTAERHAVSVRSDPHRRVRDDKGN